MTAGVDIEAARLLRLLDQQLTTRRRRRSDVKSAAPKERRSVYMPSVWASALGPRGYRSRSYTAGQKLERWLRTVCARGARRPVLAGAGLSESVSWSSHGTSGDTIPLYWPD
jgi:hypothetical protein